MKAASTITTPLFLLLLSVLLLVVAPWGCEAIIPTVPELDLEAYLGRWYQVYANRIVMATIERQGVCVFADYKEIPHLKGLISVRNVENVGSPRGPVNDVRGVAFQPRPSEEPGRLLVKFIGISSPPGSYWIIKLGPQEEDGQYQYSVVTDFDGLSLFVLARDVSTFRERYEEEVLDFVTRSGFVGSLKGPIRTRHEDCTYSSSVVPDNDHVDDMLLSAAVEV